MSQVLEKYKTISKKILIWWFGMHHLGYYYYYYYIVCHSILLYMHTTLHSYVGT